MTHSRFIQVAVGFALAGGVAAQVGATCPSWPTAERFEFVANGAEVRDKHTGLVWARCSVGQVWSGGTCIGSTSGFAHEAAVAYAATQSGWRLPNRRELFSVADKGCWGPSIDITAFPATPSTYFWTSSPYVGRSLEAWGVIFDGGIVNNHYGGRGSSFAVRLVRASQ